MVRRQHSPEEYRKSQHSCGKYSGEATQPYGEQSSRGPGVY